jgi:hypothetical protein
MPLSNENRFKCDLKNEAGESKCPSEFTYFPGVAGQPLPQWPEAIRSRLERVVAITHPLTGYTTFYCCDAHAKEAIENNQHLPPMAPKITGATEADMNNAARAAKVVNGMKVVGKPS